MSGQLIDRFGRVATDPRMSLTDRCDLRCTYCMPADGLPWLTRGDLLDVGKLTRLVGLAAGLGVNEVRLTGGEPLLRADVVDIVAAIAQLRPRPEVSITTNGTRLAGVAGALAQAGLARVNVSLDTVRQGTFRLMTRRLAGLAAAREAALTPVKVNAVLQRGVNDDQAVELLRFCLREGYQLRFIESMPLDGGGLWRRENMVTGADTLAALGRDYHLEPVAGRGSAPAERFLVDGGPGTVGVISSVTSPFCASCDRLRLTADGQLRACLFAHEESDLRTPLRAGASDSELADRMRRCVAGKKAGHGIDKPGFQAPDRPMSAIGG